MLDFEQVVLAMAQTAKARGRKRDLTTYKRIIKNRLIDAALTCFSWEGLGDHIETQFVERTLLNKGMGVFYMQLAGEVSEYSGGPDITEPRLTFNEAAAGGNYNDQWTPTHYRAIVPGGSGRLVTTAGNLEDWTGVWLTDNVRRDRSTMQTINWYAGRLAEAALTLDINLENTRTQRVALVTQEQAKTAQMIMDNVDTGNGTMIVNKLKSNAVLSEMFEVLDFTVDPQIAEVNSGIYDRILGEAYIALGITAQQNRKEAQQNVAEIEAGDSVVRAARLARLQPRQWTAEMLNKRYGLNVRVIDNGTGE